MTSPEITAQNVDAASQGEQETHLRHFLNQARQIAGRMGLALCLSASVPSVLILEQAVSPVDAAADETGGYPNAGAQDYNVSNYDWWVDENHNGRADVTSDPYDDDELMSPRGYNYRNCTDYVAWKVSSVLGVNAGSLGNAGAWDDNAKNRGFSWDYVPEPGDAAIQESSSYGHVMFVEAVNADGSVVVSDYNQAGKGKYIGPRSIAKTGLKFVDFNGTGVGLAPTTVPYADVAEGQEFYSSEGMVYTKAGGTAYYIKPKNDWNGGDSFNWGGTPVGPVPVAEAKDHELGFGNATAHPPRDYTAVYRQNDPQQYIFLGGNAYPIGAAEIDDLGVRDRAFMIPPDGRIYPFLNRPLDLQNGTLYRYAGTQRVNQLIEIPGQQASAFYVDNQTVLECLSKINAARSRVIPQSARGYLEGINGTQELQQPAACVFPSSSVVLGGTNPEAWHITGNNVTEPYQKQYYPSALGVYLNTGGTPNYTTVNPAALNDVPRGPDMGLPEGVFFGNQANGDIFKIENGSFRKVPSVETYGCLGSPPFIRVPGDAVGALAQGQVMTCAFENRQIMEPNGTVWYVKDGQRHYVQNMNIVYGLAGRANTGMPVSVSSETATQYTRSPEDAYVPYPVTVFAYNPVDGKVWKINTDGTRQHAGSMCVSDFLTTTLRPWKAVQFPTGEYNGHRDIGAWGANPQDCQQIYSEWQAAGLA